MNKLELDALKITAMDYKNEMYPLRVPNPETKGTHLVDYKFVGYGQEIGLGEQGVVRYSIDAKLEGPDGTVEFVPLKRVIQYFESKKTKKE